jgi:hypothetical protein
MPTELICWVVLLINWLNVEYLNSLSLRDTHRFKKEKNETTRTFAVKKEILGLFQQLRQTDKTDTRRNSTLI